MSDISLETLAQSLNIATAEQLHVYTGFLLSTIYPTLKVTEVANSEALRVAEFNIFTIADGSQRVITRTSIPIDPAYKYDRTKKLWMYTQPIDDIQIPAGFLSN